jgi:DNA uptake protein ComE-like DNA-binding protein
MLAAVILTNAVAMAADTSPQAGSEPASKAKPADKGVAAKPADKNAKAKPAKQAPQLLVDINRAGKADLKKLPGIDDAAADKIIAGRPYRSKADLVTRNIIAPGIYEELKRNVIAKPK